MRSTLHIVIPCYKEQEVLHETASRLQTNVLLYLAALASMYSISVSPTIFASGDRVFFMTDILLVLLVGLITKELILQTNVRNEKWFYRMKVVLVFFAVCYAVDEIAQGIIS